MRQREHFDEATGASWVTFSGEAIRLPILIAALQLGYRAWDRGLFTGESGPAYTPWKDWQGTPGEGLRRPLHAAILAANPHDTRPWLFRVSAGRIAVVADRTRLGSIMGTMAPRLEIMRQAAAATAELFSVRRWIHEGRGALWMPYQAHQIAALRELVSCWMGLAITEVLSLPDSATRRIWFHLDELDALGPIARLKDAQTRLRKKGGCVAIGFQSHADVEALAGAGLLDRDEHGLHADYRTVKMETTIAL